MPKKPQKKQRLKTLETKIRLTKINEQIPLDKPVMIVLDSDKIKGTPEEKINQVIRWIDEQELPFVNPDIIVPTILILGSYDLSHQASKQLIGAGGIFHQKPEGFDRLSRKEKIQLLKDKFTVPPDLEDPPPLICVKDEEVDLSVYENPPFQLSDEDFEEYLKHLNNPDRND